MPDRVRHDGRCHTGLDPVSRHCGNLTRHPVIAGLTRYPVIAGLTRYPVIAGLSRNLIGASAESVYKKNTSGRKP